jgi:eukaryotic-like serine/threonine-protein kinase
MMDVLVGSHAMNRLRQCSQCGASLPSDAPEGVCPRCELRGALELDREQVGSSDLGLIGATTDPGCDPAGDPAPPSISPVVFGDYELLEEIARGGMGVVYKARQKRLNRIVAVKMVLAAQFGGKSFVQRFRAEASAAAILQHPNIVAIHDVGVQDGQHFFSMDYVEGQNLAQLVGLRPLQPRQAARYLKLIAEAIHYAHQQGILHRDLKPSNVLIETATDQPRLTDFGLAKRLDGNSTLTLTGQVLGSPNFMPPEQASGTSGKVGRQTDVYGLGAILFYLLTARAPFQAESLEGIIRQVSEAEPVSPRLLNPIVPSDLETICLKCLEKEPARRYSTAQELADELGRFLKDEPVHARPVSRTENIWRWCRRKPALATAYAIVLVLILVVVLGAPIAVLRIDRARAEANQARVAAERNLYAAEMRLASQALRDGAIGQVQGLLTNHLPRKGAEDLRGFEWRYLQNAARQVHLMTHELQGLSGSLVLKGSNLYDFREESDQILAWDTVTWAPLPLKVPAQRASEQWWFYPAQQAALAVNDQSRTITVHRLPAFDETSTIPLPGRAFRAAISGDFRTLAVAFQDGDAQGVLVRDLAANSERRIFGDFRGKVTHLNFSPDGRVLVCACHDGEIGLWSIPEGKVLPSPARDASSPQEDWPHPPFFGPGSTRLYLDRGRARNALEVWDWSTGKRSALYQARAGQLQAFAFSSDGSILAIADSIGSIVLLDTKDFRSIGVLPVRGAPIGTLAFSPSGSLIAAGGLDRSTTLWEVTTQRELQTLGGNDNTVFEVVFTPDEKSICTRMGDGQIKIWDLRAVLAGGLLWRATNSVEGFTISPDERAIATKDNLGNLHVWNLISGAHIQSVPTGEPNSTALLFAMSFSPTDRIVAWTGCSSFGILNYQSGQSKSFPLSRQGSYSDPAFSPDGRELAVAGATNILILDMATRELRPFAASDNTVYGLAFSPDGTLLASVDNRGTLILRDGASGHQIAKVPAHSSGAFNVSFSPDGRLLATSGLDTTGKLWDVTHRGLKFRLQLRGFVGRVGLLFSPDGRRVAAARSGDNVLQLWDTNTGLEVGAIFGRRGAFSGFAFSRDGNSIYSAAEDGDVRLWQAPPLAQLDALGHEKARPE